MKTPHPHAENMRLYAEDAADTDKPWLKWQYRNSSAADWCDCMYPISWEKSVFYRRKPSKKPIDLSILVASGIDCEFWDEGSTTDDTPIVGPLVSIAKKRDSYHEYPYTVNHGGRFERCRPRMNHWHSWQGGECPVPDGVIGSILFRDGAQSNKRKTLSDWLWVHLQYSGDIIAFRITGLADDYCWPWETDQ